MSTGLTSRAAGRSSCVTTEAERSFRSHTQMTFFAARNRRRIGIDFGMRCFRWFASIPTVFLWLRGNRERTRERPAGRVLREVSVLGVMRYSTGSSASADLQAVSADIPPTRRRRRRRRRSVASAIGVRTRLVRRVPAASAGQARVITPNRPIEQSPPARRQVRVEVRVEIAPQPAVVQH